MEDGSSSIASAAVVVSLFAPVNASMPARVGGGVTLGSFEGAVTVQVLTDDPFADTVHVEVTNRAPLNVPLWLRIPGWATNATISLSTAGVLKAPVQAPAGQYYKGILCPGGSSTEPSLTSAVLELNPVIVLQQGWGSNPPDAKDQEDASYPGIENAAAVVRGPLLFALPLTEHPHLLNKWVCDATGCSTDISITSNSTWNYALLLPTTAASTVGVAAGPGRPPGIRDIPNPSTMRLVRSASGNVPKPHPFAGSMDVVQPGMMPLHILAKARRLHSWVMDKRFASTPQSPPVSPVSYTGDDAATGSACGVEEEVKLVPFGTTRLRMGVMPWTVADTNA